MNVEDSKIVESDDTQHVSQPVDKSRRSFAKTGLVAPVILTLANRSAWGANACVGTGFGSYSTAVVKPSHSTFQADLGWRQPKTGLPEARNGWYELPNEWPIGFRPVHKSGSDAYTSPIGAWSSTKTKRRVIGNNLGVYPSNSGAIVFVYQLGGVYSSVDSTLTVYDALNVGGDLAYELAGLLNQALTPSTPFPPLGSGDYDLFYTNCTS